jgi:hypothetical protein
MRKNHAEVTKLRDDALALIKHNQGSVFSATDTLYAVAVDSVCYTPTVWFVTQSMGEAKMYKRQMLDYFHWANYGTRFHVNVVIIEYKKGERK